MIVIYGCVELIVEIHELAALGERDIVVGQELGHAIIGNHLARQRRKYLGVYFANRDDYRTRQSKTRQR